MKKSRNCKFADFCVQDYGPTIDISSGDVNVVQLLKAREEEVITSFQRTVPEFYTFLLKIPKNLFLAIFSNCTNILVGITAS